MLPYLKSVLEIWLVVVQHCLLYCVVSAAPGDLVHQMVMEATILETGFFAGQESSH